MSQVKVRDIIIERFKEDLIGHVGGSGEQLFKDPDYFESFLVGRGSR